MIYKELKDFQAGARVNAIMSPFALPLSDPDMIDLASYYTYLPRLPAYHPAAAVVFPRVVINGAPLRNIAPAARATAPWTTRPEVLGSKGIGRLHQIPA